MKWRSLVALTTAAVACRVGDLVETPAGRGGRLEFSVQPSLTEIGKPITPPVQVTVRDDAGRPDTAYHDSVALDLGANPGGATVSGTWRARVDGGIATFADLWVDKPGDGYVLRATAPGRPAAMSHAPRDGASAPRRTPSSTRFSFFLIPGRSPCYRTRTQVGESPYLWVGPRGPATTNP